MSVFGKRRVLPVNVVPSPEVIRYMWEQGIYLLISNGVYQWIDLQSAKASSTGA